MNAQQRAFYRQATADWKMYRMLRGHTPRVPCHELHFLQMATEKFAKAYLWGTTTPPRPVHASFVQFLRLAAQKSKIREALGVPSRPHFRDWLHKVLPLAAQIENLAPQLAGNGPNPEYPWPSEMPEIAPVDFEFLVIAELEASHGRKLIGLVSLLMEMFPSWA